MEARRVPASLIPNVEVQAGAFGTAHSGVSIALPVLRKNVVRAKRFG
jgi:hypothetical protein